MGTIDSHPGFDAQYHDYALDRYPFPAWTLQRVQAAGYDVDDLERLHEVLPAEDQPALTKRLIEAAGDPEFQDMLYGFIDEYVKPLIGGLEVAVQRYPNIRIVRPARPDMVLPYHQGIWVGHGWGIGTLWLPMTRAFDTNTMQIMGLDESRRLTRQCIAELWDRDTMQDVFAEATHPCNLNPGSAVFFTEGNIHGNVENKTGITRMSIDVRVLEKGGQFHRKSPGGYFVPPGSHINVADASMVKRRERQLRTLSYSEMQTQMTKGIPVPLQRLAIKEYCEPRNIKFAYEHVELEGLLHCPILMSLLRKDQADEVILYSIFSLPEDESHRRALLDAALENGITLHFVNELLVMRNDADRDVIERTRTFSLDYSSPVVTTADLARA